MCDTQAFDYPALHDDVVQKQTAIDGQKSLN